jgi:hypothetical protein
LGGHGEHDATYGKTARIDRQRRIVVTFRNGPFRQSDVGRQLPLQPFLGFGLAATALQLAVRRLRPDVSGGARERQQDRQPRGDGPSIKRPINLMMNLLHYNPPAHRSNAMQSIERTKPAPIWRGCIPQSDPQVGY